MKTIPLLLACSVMALALPLAGHAATPTGQFIKGSGDTIYWLGQDNKRYVFPDDATLQSWLSQHETQGVVLADEDLAAHPIGGAMTVRPGTVLVRFASDPTTYVVSHGAMLHAVTDELATAHYGVDWNKKVQLLDVTLFTTYHVGNPLKFASDYDLAREAKLAATADNEVRNKLTAGAKTPKPFRGTVAFTEEARSSSTTLLYIVTVTDTNAPIHNLRIDVYNEAGVHQNSCVASDRCDLLIDTTKAKTDMRVRYYALVSNERDEALERAYTPQIIITPPSSLPRM